MSNAFAQNYERALSGYSNEAGQINQNLANWRSDVDMTRQANKSGFASARSQAENKVDMDAIKGVADEFGLQGGKKLYQKYITKGLLDKKFFGNRSFNEVDKDLGDRLKAGIKSKLGIGQSKDGVGGEGEGTFEDFVKSRLGGTTEEATQRLNNLRSSVGETKSDIGGFAKEKVDGMKSTGADDEGVEMQTTDDLTNNNSLLRGDPYGREAPKTSGLTDADKGRGVSSSAGEEKVPDAEPDAPDYVRDPNLVTNPPLSDRVATPEEKPPSFEELKSRFSKLSTQPESKGGSIEMGETDTGGTPMVRQSSQGYNELDRVDADPLRPSSNPLIKGEYNSQSTLADFRRNNPKVDGLGGGSSDANSVGVRNAAGDAEQAGQDAVTSARSGIAGASQAGEDMANGARNAASDAAENIGSRLSSLKNMGQQALTDGSEGAGSMFSNAVKKIGGKIAGAGAEAGGEEAAGGGLEAAGALLDATPLAPLGWLFGGIGAALDIGAAYQAGKGIADWVSDDILGHHPAVNFKKTALPSTSAIPRSFSITPTMDSTMDIGSGSGSW